MAQTININHASVSVRGAEACSFLQAFLAGHHANESQQPTDLVLTSGAQGLELIWNRAESKPLKFHLDFEQATKQLRSFPAPKQGAFNQALGKKTKQVIDATGGWGGDALLMCLQGYQVSVIERLPIIAVLLDEAFARLKKSSWAIHNEVRVPSVTCGDAAEILNTRVFNADCVYLDPMFPPKRKKTAAVNKKMQLLQWLAGPDADANDTARVAVEQYPRLAVKRPDYAEPLIVNPSSQFSSKLVHYDVYLNDVYLSSASKLNGKLS